METGSDHISVCVCTFKRGARLGRLLEELAAQPTGNLFSYSIVVSDNDRGGSARSLVTEFASRAAVPVTYCIEPVQNVALARNNAVANAKGNYIAFIDDDESPSPDWLLGLYRTCQEHGADGALGPVISRFEQPPPEWVSKGGFFDRPRHPTGMRIGLQDMRTGNVLFKTAILDPAELPFRGEFGTGGEDVDFFRRVTRRGALLVWSDESLVFEDVSCSRFKRSYLMRRALRRGGNTYKFVDWRARGIAKALVALPLYGLSLPFLLLAGQHLFMKYTVKICDHAGLLLASVGISPFSTYKSS